MCVGEAEECDCGDASSGVSLTELLSLGWEGSQTFSRTRSTADASDVEQISSEDEPILILPTDAKRAELDMIELEELEKLFATPTTKEHVLMDVEPSQTTSAHSSTLQIWPLSHAELASLVAEACCGPFQRGVRCCETEENENQSIAFGASVCCCSKPACRRGFGKYSTMSSRN